MKYTPAENSFYIRAIKHFAFIFAFISVLSLAAQEQEPQKTEAPKPAYEYPKISSIPYVKREEVLYDGKRYRIYNNYLTAGAGFLSSSIRSNSQKMVGADFHFHIRKQYFQVGGMMSGDEFLSNNNSQVHVCYGLRRERNTTSLAAYLGPSYFYGVEGTPGVTDPRFYSAWGLYGSIQAISKFISYDIGFGGELFGEVSDRQTIFGFKIVVFFSGAYRGLKRPYNPNVRAENPNLK